MLGIDIHSTVIYTVKLSRKKPGWILEWATALSLPAVMIQEGNLSAENQTTLLLQEGIHKNYSRRHMVCAIALPAHLTIVQTIVLPMGLTSDEIKQEIVTQIQRELPEVTENLHIDFSMLSQQEDGYKHIFYAATKQTVLTQYVNCVQQAGLFVKIVDIDIYALCRIINLLMPNYLLQTHYFIFHFFANRAILLAINHQQLVFYQTWNCNEYTDLFTQLQHYIQFYIGGYANQSYPRNIVLYPQIKWLTQLKDDLKIFNKIHIYHTKLIESLFVNENEIFSLLPEADTYLIAISLAMRSTVL